MLRVCVGYIESNGKSQYLDDAVEDVYGIIVVVLRGSVNIKIFFERNGDVDGRSHQTDALEE